LPVFHSGRHPQGLQPLEMGQSEPSGKLRVLALGRLHRRQYVKLRFDTFKPKQLVVLNALHKSGGWTRLSQSIRKTKHCEIVTKLRSYYGTLPEAVEGVRKLSDDARKLFQVLKKLGWIPRMWRIHCWTSPVQQQTRDQIRATLQTLLDSSSQSKGERAAAVRQVITTARASRTSGGKSPRRFCNREKLTLCRHLSGSIRRIRGVD